ncbi:elongation factor-1 alpha [Gammaproteobacteria bacterium 45_16_T64]|nr:elongation factor-1 alpha [Gammaproteobacteria bacterium 45_16_T64]
MKNSTDGWLNLPSLSLPLRTLFTGYLLVTGLGLMMAGVQILLTHGMADGKLGVSIDDIVYSYYGDRGNSRLEAKLNGSMKDKAPVEVRTQIIQWVQDGAPEQDWEPKVKGLFKQNCTQCHGNIPGLPDFNKLAAVKHVAEVDKGASVDSLTRVSHIHLFGIAFIFFFIGLIFSLSVGIKPWVKATIIFIPFIFLILDVFSWWLVKWYPNFAVLTIIGGFGYSVASGFMMLTSLYQMWIIPFKGESHNENTWKG